MEEGANNLLRTTASGQLFTAFGEPDAESAPVGAAPDGRGQSPAPTEGDGGWVVTVRGVDIHGPMTGAMASAPIAKVAGWSLDTDSDGRTFWICQALLPQTTAWDKLARARKGTLAPERNSGLPLRTVEGGGDGGMGTR